MPGFRWTAWTWTASRRSSAGTAPSATAKAGSLTTASYTFPLASGSRWCVSRTGRTAITPTRGSVQVPVIDGALPLTVPRGFKGTLTDAEQQAWLARILHLVNYMEGTVWQQNISQIHVNKDGDLVLYPREGKERFLFGSPTQVEAKFALMEAYYESVAPSKAPGWYSLVDVRHRKQLVCRK